MKSNPKHTNAGNRIPLIAQRLKSYQKGIAYLSAELGDTITAKAKGAGLLKLIDERFEQLAVLIDETKQLLDRIEL